MSDLAGQALAALRGGRLAEATRLAQEALAAAPGDADAFGVLGLVAAQRRDVREAANLLTKAVAGGSRLPDLAAALMGTYGRLNGPAAMEAHVRDLLDAQPLNTSLRVALVQHYYQTGRPDEELAVCAAGIAAGDAALRLLLLKGRGLLNSDQAIPAIEVLRQYTEQVPTDPQGHFLLGNALQFTGQAEAAREAFLAAMAQEAFHPPSFYAYSRSGKIASDDPLVTKLDQVEVLFRSADDVSASYYHYGLGQILEGLGRFDDAWDNYERGGTRLLKAHRYSRPETEARVRSIAEVFSEERCAALAGQGNTSARPIFIVGMPRSGSTLVEQILSGHSEVVALGEILDLENTCRPVLAQMARPGSEALVPDLAKAYLSLVGARAQRLEQTGRRTIDKGLHNFWYVGFIAAMFPNATILHMVRDPLDTCVSCFALRFAKGHEWSNRLSDLAHFYSQYRAMMDHWNKVLPGRIVDVSYEALTRDFEPEVRKLLDACELPWEDQVLSFVGADRAVRTASAAQVREGITTTSVARWKRFEPHLDELKNALKDYL